MNRGGGDEISRTVINCKKNLNISISKFLNLIRYGNLGCIIFGKYYTDFECSRIREFFENDRS